MSEGTNQELSLHFHPAATKKKKKLKRIEIIQNIVSDHNGIKLEINYRKTTEKSSNNLKLNDIFNNVCQRESLKERGKLNKSENTTYQNIWDTAIIGQRGKLIAIKAYI